jgi:alkanesulfonate monooxygenase SsuD/methylene tetrahydromethanopterin reductase-like flavin-dependent oxidoreductase (luciferase family)
VAGIARPIRGAAVGAKTSRIEIGTAVIDTRYENPLYMVEDAGVADLIAGGRLQLGISRGSPEQVIDGWSYFGYRPAEGQSDVDMGRLRAEVFLDLLRGEATGACTVGRATVVAAMRTPRKVRWPDWWESIHPA